METSTLVHSYIRSNKREANEPQNTESIALPLTLIAGVVILTAVVYWTVAIPLGFVGAAVWGGSKLVYQIRHDAITVAPAPLEQPKPKRHYEKRIRVNHYQTNKPIRI